MCRDEFANGCGDRSDLTMYLGQSCVGFWVWVSAATLLVNAALFFEPGGKLPLAVEYGFALFSGELDILVAVTIAEQVGNLATVLTDKTANETGDRLPQVIVSNPRLKAGFQ